MPSHSNKDKGAVGEPHRSSWCFLRGSILNDSDGMVGVMTRWHFLRKRPEVRHKVEKCAASLPMRIRHVFPLPSSSHLGPLGEGQKLELDHSTAEPGILWKGWWAPTHGHTCPVYTSSRVRPHQDVHETHNLNGDVQHGHLVQGDSVALEAARTAGSESLHGEAGCGKDLSVSNPFLLLR